ncbi:MAG: hypothetical protein GEV05_28290 [Betaproteobacteria bacterium]|nr:hypothetical protein [Betaproteobacteria bacterium]
MTDLDSVLAGDGFARLCRETAERHRIDAEGLPCDGRPPCGPPTVAEVAAVVRWMLLGREAPRGRILSSYGAKHVAEDWNAALGFLDYVPNGAAIVAAALLDQNWKPERGPNCKWRRLRDPESAFMWLRHQIVGSCT